MSVVEDARRLAESEPKYGHDISPYICETMVEYHEDCFFCGKALIGPRRERLGEHEPDCPWLAMPRIVAALEAAQRGEGRE